MKNEEYDLQLLSFFGIKYRQTYTVRVKEIFFTLPSAPNILIFCDGASKGNQGAAGYGFIARTHLGAFLTGVSGGIGVATNFLGEVLAVVCAGEWAIQNNHLQVCFKTDSHAAVLAIQSNKLPWPVVTRWNRVCDKLQGHDIMHNYREVNFNAEKLAKEGSGIAKNTVKIYNF
ncbi:uncharacterized protein LOC113279488 [Papaver somniferum]|uniref:uncharacterized protein LOC113279488 n=1 Tax=Papaver somniferum TaxID=3469 RepID=UPI000E6FF779|nr:uncharacterized protein LOC113279488 [Papaver somniferum]